MSVFNNIEAAVASLLTAAPAVSTRVQRGRARPLPAEETNAVAVQVTDSEPLASSFDESMRAWRTRVEVEVQARAQPNESPTTAVDAVMVLVSQKIAASRTLGGVVTDITLQSITWATDEADYAYGSATMAYDAIHEVVGSALA